MKLLSPYFCCIKWSALFLLGFLSGSVNSAVPEWLNNACPVCIEQHKNKSGVFILDRGEDSLMVRGWLAAHAEATIDVQYFIWSTDNIGILASEALLRAAEKGVKVRVLVDDLLVDASDDVLLALATHPNVDIRIYNPQHSVGISLLRRLWNIVSGFRRVNQRMHDKTVIFDGVSGITGGRNMADEYYDFDHRYNFRDRDVLLFGPVISAMTDNFEEFWVSDLAVPVTSLLPEALDELSPKAIDDIRQELHDYAANPENFEPEVRQALKNLPTYFPQLSSSIIWDDVQFISDRPGKNNNQVLLSGGGESTEKLTRALALARHSVLIQSPYLVFPKGGLELLSSLIQRGVRVRISTNSLASTDNIMAFSGYYKQRQSLLDIGVEIYEFKPDAIIRQQLSSRKSDAVFALHAKSMLIDDEVLYIGTFNLDPRSANLNTEVGILVTNRMLGDQFKASIEADIHSDNSWIITTADNPDDQVSFFKWLKVLLLSWLPLDALL
jgi:putative cardiolipin synthase